MANFSETSPLHLKSAENQPWIKMVSAALIFSADHLMKKRFTGEENLHEAADYVNRGRGGLLVTPNHNSFIDSYLMRLVRQQIAPEKKFVVLWANKFTGKDTGKYAGTGQEDLNKVSTAGKIGKEAAKMAGIELIDVPQEAVDIAAARQALNNLEIIGGRVFGNNDVLGVFPEGTRSRTGRLGVGKRGLTYLFKNPETNGRTLILPVAATGTGELLSPDTEKLKPLVTVSVIYGKPYTYSQAIEEMNQYGLSFEAVLMWHIGKLLPEDRWGVYEDVFSKIKNLELKNPPVR